MALAETQPRRVRVFRALFVLAGWLIAALGLFAFSSDQTATYVAYGVLMVVVRLFWIEGARTFDFSLPYLATSTAFVYILGLPVITLDYLIGTPMLAAYAVLADRGWLRSSPMMHIVTAGREGPAALGRALIDVMSGYTIAAMGLGFRFLVFNFLRRQFPEVTPVLFLVVTELMAWTFSGALTFLLPLPPGDLFKAEPPWKLGIEDERVDVTYATTLLMPLLVLLIFYGFQVHGMIGAFAWSLCTLGPHYLLKLLHDRRTSLVQRHHALTRLNADLKRQQEDQKAFVYTVTHDLKGPVSAILLTADMALEREGGMMPADTREDLDHIAQLASGTEDMIRDLMGLFEIVSAPEPSVDVSLQDIVRRGLDTLRPQLSAKNVQVDVGPIPPVRGQARKLEHLVANLLSNAVKYTRATGGIIALSAEQRDGATVLCVRDNGIGISAEYHQTIFDLFTRVPAQDQLVNGEVVAGSGVGLAIVKQVIEAHEGSVWVESSPGEGSRFYVRFPARPDASRGN